MSTYCQQAAACDLQIIDGIARKALPGIQIDRTKVQGEMAKRHVLRSRLPTSPVKPAAVPPATRAAQAAAAGESCAVKMVSNNVYNDLLQEYEEAVQALCDVMSHTDAVELLPVGLQQRIQDIVAHDADTSTTQSIGESVESIEDTTLTQTMSPTSDGEHAFLNPVDSLTPSTAAKARAAMGGASCDELPLPTCETSASLRPGRRSMVRMPSGRRGSSPAAIMRVGGRRYTVSITSPRMNPQKKKAKKGALAWKNMQNRLAEVKFQTMLQSYCDSEQEHPVYKVVLTGGPCAGKSSGMSCMRSELELQGYNVFCVPEAATLLIRGGGAAAFGVGTEDASYGFQLALLETQMALEDAFIALANACKKKAVVLCDRGSMDGRAFCDERLWNRILESGGWSTEELRDQRYDLVLHLVTAADGAPEFYGDETNKCRTETAEQAIEQDLKLQGCWTGFPHLRVIDNSTNFNEKMQRCMRPILELVGIDRRPGSLKKYLLQEPLAQEEIDIPTTRCTLTIQLLKGSKPDNVIHIIHRVDGRSHTYTYQNIRQQDANMLKIERTLDVKAYENFLAQVDGKAETIVKDNILFIYKNQTFELGTYVRPESKRGTSILNVETNKDVNGNDLEVQFPAFLLALAPEDITLERVDGHIGI